jgi:hypothetical protein
MWRTFTASTRPNLLALPIIKVRIRQLTRLYCGRSMYQVVVNPRPCLLGSKAYFALLTTLCPARVGRIASLNESNTTQALGSAKDVVKQLALSSSRWAHGATAPSCLTALIIACFVSLGVPASHDLTLANRPLLTRMPGGVIGAQSIMTAPFPMRVQHVRTLTGTSSVVS